MNRGGGPGGGGGGGGGGPEALEEAVVSHRKVVAIGPWKARDGKCK